MKFAKPARLLNPKFVSPPNRFRAFAIRGVKIPDYAASFCVHLFRYVWTLGQSRKKTYWQFVVSNVVVSKHSMSVTKALRPTDKLSGLFDCRSCAYLILRISGFRFETVLSSTIDACLTPDLRLGEQLSERDSFF